MVVRKAVAVAMVVVVRKVAVAMVVTVRKVVAVAMVAVLKVAADMVEGSKAAGDMVINKAAADIAKIGNNVHHVNHVNNVRPSNVQHARCRV